MCFDFQIINNTEGMYLNHMPYLDGMLKGLHGAYVNSKTDLARQLHHVRVRENHELNIE